jgi:glycosyltransferase involved in cell wall biosynthesis
MRRVPGVSVVRPKVLWVYGWPNAFGGSLNSLLDVLRHVDRDSFEVAALLPGDGSTSREIEALRIPILYEAMPPAGKNLRYLRAVWAFRRLLEREAVDLVYFADYASWRPALLLGARLCGKPVVVHLHWLVSQAFVSDRFLREVPAIIGNSRATLEALRGLVADDRLHVIHNCIDLASCGPGPDRRGEFFPRNAPLVGFVGIFRPEKGVETFLDMARLIRARRPEVRYLAVGGESVIRDRGWLEKMKGHADEIGVGDVVRFTGTRRDIPEIMRSLDVLVVPSLTEGFGRVILEANGVGTPVVATAVGGIPEVIEEGVTGFLVPPRDAEAMAETVLRVLGDSAWRARVALVAPQRIRERFSPDTQVCAIEAVWRGALCV